jgi:hypothetical protein
MNPLLKNHFMDKRNPLSGVTICRVAYTEREAESKKLQSNLRRQTPSYANAEPPSLPRVMKGHVWKRRRNVAPINGRRQYFAVVENRPS